MAINLLTGAAVGLGLASKFLKNTLTDAPLTPRFKFAGKDDYRVKLKVPRSLITQYAHGPLFGFDGIVFPYTPTISYEMNASYASMTPMHSNYPINFYKHSGVSSFTVSAKFTVQNDTDAIFYLTTMHLLRALTKMRYGNDTQAGSPPPVCRFDAYGDFMLKNIPVVVQSVRSEYPDSVDYYELNPELNPNSLAGVDKIDLGTNFVPTISSITLNLLPMYSRFEQSQFSVEKYVTNPDLRRKGFI
jgi:hypothetical protein